MTYEEARRWRPVPPTTKGVVTPSIDYPKFSRAFRSGPILVKSTDVSVRLLPRRSALLTDRPRVEVLHQPTGRVVRMDIGDTYRAAITNAVQVLNAHLVVETNPGTGPSGLVS
jgi:hypothetical protein